MGRGSGCVSGCHTLTGALQAALAGLGEGLSTFVCVVVHLLTFLAKVAVVIALQLAIRWSLPRLGYAQVMDLCWKILLPLSIANAFVTGTIILLVGSFEA